MAKGNLAVNRGDKLVAMTWSDPAGWVTLGNGNKEDNMSDTDWFDENEGWCLQRLSDLNDDVCMTVRLLPLEQRKFPMGTLVMTKNAMHQLDDRDVAKALERHLTGDWGDIESEDWEQNESALRDGFRLFSVYRDRRDSKFWIITEADRSVTTVLLPKDY